MTDGLAWSLVEPIEQTVAGMPLEEIWVNRIGVRCRYAGLPT